jgi:hypothetical protein
MGLWLTHTIDFQDIKTVEPSSSPAADLQDRQGKFRLPTRACENSENSTRSCGHGDQTSSSSACRAGRGGAGRRESLTWVSTGIPRRYLLPRRQEIVRCQRAGLRFLLLSHSSSPDHRSPSACRPPDIRTEHQPDAPVLARRCPSKSLLNRGVCDISPSPSKPVPGPAGRDRRCRTLRAETSGRGRGRIFICSRCSRRWRGR